MGKKFLISLLIINFLSIIFINNIMAASSLDDIIGGAGNFITQGDKGSEGTDYTGFNNTLVIVFNTFLTIGTILAAIVLAIMGIMFMMSPIEEKAKIKESLIPFVIGCCVIFGAFTIWKVVINIASLME